MAKDISWIIYFTFYIIVIAYFITLGWYMMTRRADELSSDGEQAAKLRMTRTMAVTMFVWAFAYFIYVPPMLLECNPGCTVYNVYFFINLMIFIPLVYVVMFAIVQKKVNILKWICGLSLPFFVLAIWYIITPPQ